MSSAAWPSPSERLSMALVASLPLIALSPFEICMIVCTLASCEP